MDNNRLDRIKQGLDKDLYRNIEKLQESGVIDSNVEVKTEKLASLFPENSIEEELAKTLELVSNDVVEMNVDTDATELIGRYADSLKKHYTDSLDLDTLTEQDVMEDIEAGDIIFDDNTAEIIEIQEVEINPEQEAVTTVLIQDDEDTQIEEDETVSLDAIEDSLKVIEEEDYDKKINEILGKTDKSDFVDPDVDDKTIVIEDLERTNLETLDISRLEDEEELVEDKKEKKKFDLVSFILFILIAIMLVIIYMIFTK